MFVLCVLYSKDKRQSQDNQNKEVQMKYIEQKKNSVEAPAQTVPGAHPAFYTVDTGSLSRG